MKLITILSLITICVSCSKQPQPLVTVVVNGKNEYALNGDEQSEIDFHADLPNQYRIREANPVQIRVSSQASSNLVLAAAHICLARGFWDLTFVDESGNSFEFDYNPSRNNTEMPNTNLNPISGSSIKLPEKG